MNVLFKFYLTSVTLGFLATSALFRTRRIRAVYLTANPPQMINQWYLTSDSRIHYIQSTINKHTKKTFKTPGIRHI